MITRQPSRLTPKNDHVAMIIVVLRVSDPNAADKSAGHCSKQDIRSLDDQKRLSEEWIDSNIDCQYETTFIYGTGSGEYLDREEVLQLEQLVATGRYDLILTEDLGRIMRRFASFIFCEASLDSKTRVVAINDRVDTFQEGWQESAIFAAMHHERSNRDNSSRVKRTLRNRFMLDEAEQLPIFGQIRPEGARSMADWYKDPAAEAIYQKWFQLLDDGATFGEVADWLNANNVPVGPYCRLQTWDAQMVARITYNPFLKGLRTHNKTISVRNSRGKYRPEKAAPELLMTRELPHLAFFDADYYDRIVAQLRAKNARYSRKSKDNGKDIRTGMPRKRTRFPGQMVDCGECGRSCNYGGEASGDRLFCSGAIDYKCWNAVGLSGPLVTEKVLEAILAEVECLPEWDERMLATIQEEALKLDADRERRLQQLADGERECRRKRDHLIKFVSEGDFSSGVRELLAETERSLGQISVDRQRLERQPRQTVEIPPMCELKRLAREVLTDIDRNDPEFQALMRRMVPRLVVFPYKPCDGGHIVPRVQFRWTPAGLLPDPRLRELLTNLTEKVITVDPYVPPDRVLALPTVLANPDLSKPELEARFGIEQHTVKQARKLIAVMAELGITDPYIPLVEPPDTGFSRHKHARYRFEPLPHAGEV